MNPKFKVGDIVISCDKNIFTVGKIELFSDFETSMADGKIGYWYWDNSKGVAYQAEAIRLLTKLERVLK